ncbi:uncharacterized protein LOC122672320 [Telopea speciosissima]|uniref:uncharacterized protein LOC122672320 n=1 Tax=Telopea speciosissima TaxID=54955 RepID=UPI001CC364D7|nr:uncharacterized protein LOC122672320 [Telopea speciosissima]
MGEELKDSVAIKKILRSLPRLYNAKVSAIEESKDLNKLSLDELHGTLTAYEMRMVDPAIKEKETAFKAMRKMKIDEDNIEEEDSDDELIAYLARRLKKDNNKFKGKLPLRCFDCGQPGHFASKCPKKNQDSDSDDEDAGESKYKKGKKKFVPKKNNYKKKGLISKKKASSDESSEEDQSNTKYSETLFVAFKEKNSKGNDGEVDITEEQFDLEAKLFGALSNLKVALQKCNSLHNQLKEKEKIVEELKATMEELKDFNNISLNLETKTKNVRNLKEPKSIITSTKDTITDKEDAQTEGEFEKTFTTNVTQRFKPHFLGYYEICGAYGHRTRNCQFNEAEKGKAKVDEPESSSGKQIQTKKQQKSKNNKGIKRELAMKALNLIVECKKRTKSTNTVTFNRFASLAEEEEVVCYRCQRTGHIAVGCRAVLPSQRQTERGQKQNAQAESKQRKAREPIIVVEKAVWVEKKKESSAEGDKALVVQAAFKANAKTKPWILDSGCSNHMSGDKGRFLKLKSIDGGNVRFGNNGGAKIEGKGTVKLNSGKIE